MTLEPEVTWSCGVFCKLEDSPKTTHFWIQFLNFELDEDWLLQLDQRTFVIGQQNHWQREITFSGQAVSIEMACSWNRPGSTPLALLIAYLRAMKLQLNDATQFIQDVVEESEEEDDE